MRELWKKLKSFLSKVIEETAEGAVSTTMWAEGYTSQDIEWELKQYRERQAYKKAIFDAACADYSEPNHGDVQGSKTKL